MQFLCSDLFERSRRIVYLKSSLWNKLLISSSRYEVLMCIRRNLFMESLGWNYFHMSTELDGNSLLTSSRRPRFSSVQCLFTKLFSLFLCYIFIIAFTAYAWKFMVVQLNLILPTDHTRGLLRGLRQRKDLGQKQMTNNG